MNAIMKTMTPCPKTPNCVSSVDTDPKHFIQPLQFVGKATEAHERLLKILYSLKRVRIVASGEDFIHAEREDEHMAKENNNTFIVIKDPKGEKFLCPINTNPNHSSGRIEVNDDCIEEDVIGRYAGNIKKTIIK